jgi:hypothetical protein
MTAQGDLLSKQCDPGNKPGSRAGFGRVGGVNGSVVSIPPARSREKARQEAPPAQSSRILGMSLTMVRTSSSVTVPLKAWLTLT